MRTYAKLHKMKQKLKLIILIMVVFLIPGRIGALSFNLDSVAEWGKFPRFCVNTYRWGDRFFNGYDSAYVDGSGYKFNVKLKSETWLDGYMFQLPDNYRITMASDLNSSMGVYLSYLAVSLGYDINVGKIFGGTETLRRKFDFGFNCALFAAQLYWITNNVGTDIKSYGYSSNLQRCNIPFKGINNTIFGVDAYYFLNHSRYSHAAAFTYGRIQKRSQGSWFVGLSYWTQNFTFDFSQTPDDIKNGLPTRWADNEYVYNINNHNYAIRAGYAYNWVFKRHWVLGVSESPLFGLKHGTVNGEAPQSSISLYNRAQISCVWNNRAWFAGVILSNEFGFYLDHKQTDHKQTLINGIINFQATLGYRFNLW